MDSRIAHGLMFDLGIELRAEQNHDGGDPHPHHHANSGSQRAVCSVVIGEFREIPRKQR